MQRWANKIWTSPSSFYPTVTLWLLLRRQCLKVCYYCEGRLLSLPFSMAIRDPYKQFNLPLDILALCTKWNLVFGNKKTLQDVSPKWQQIGVNKTSYRYSNYTDLRLAETSWSTDNVLIMCRIIQTKCVNIHTWDEGKSLLGSRLKLIPFTYSHGLGVWLVISCFI